MTKNELSRRFPNASEAFLRANKDRVESEGESPKPECNLGNESLGKDEVKEVNSGRVKIIYHVFRSRLCDPDNVFLKYHTNGLRYEGLIRDDRNQDIEIEVEQFKSREEFVIITLIYPNE
jgi:hypothetical protein